MSIEFKNNRFHLYNSEISYVLEIGAQGDLLNVHFGASVEADEPLVPSTYINAMFFVYSDAENRGYALSMLPQEYPSSGMGDFRSPAYEISTAKGLHTPRLKYVSHEIVYGKPALKGLPSTYAESDDEAQTLIITTEDKLHGIQVKLFYTVFENFNAVCRHSEITNIADTPTFLKNAQSVSLDFPAGDYEYIHLQGAWARETHVERNAVHKGSQGFESRRGASGHTENPFLMFFDKGSNESYGNVYGISLVYSGNHKFLIERESAEVVRVQAGINPFEFNFKLEAGDSFVTPEAVIVFSDKGFAKMSHTFHKLYRTRLCRSEWTNKARPILINNWEATYFDFNKEKLLKIADAAAKIGLDLFVLDDGWFGGRSSDSTSLGDWFVNEEKLGGTLAELAQEINNRGLKFGLWFEPEMISKASKLYEKHPDWAIRLPEGEPMMSRYQYVLNLTKPEVREYIVNAVSAILKSANIEYVKWDMNRNMSDIYSDFLPADRQGEFYHRYILGLYEVVDKLTSSFPHILFEGCASGGGRNDPGMLHYMPQNWASDDTDAVERLYIQYGTSMVYPVSTVGSHVSAVPNHQVKRISSLSTRGTVAMNGAFGYELDLSKLSEEELDEMKEQVKFYKENRELIFEADYYRLLDPFTSCRSSWMYVSPDKSQALLYYVVKHAHPSNEFAVIKLKGLEPDAKYDLDGKVYTGKTLMNRGLIIEAREYEGFNFIKKLTKIS